MTQDLKQAISNAINNCAEGNLFESALHLFQSLGYPTPIQSPLDNPSWPGFKSTYLPSKPINEKVALTDDWKYFNILFQLTDDAIRKQVVMFTSGRVDNAIMNSFLFLVLELKKDHYTKTELSQVTREINKIFAMPAIILFKTGDHLTLAVINRRLNKRDEGKDVLEKVTLIKDISIRSPHRAHIEILFDLSFTELQRKHGFTSFVELHKAWEKTLDIKELNKRFFKELFNWYHWAVRSVRFPNKVSDDKDDMQFNQEAVIRMLTRLIFIWFIKEKNLVPATLFDDRFIKTVLKNFDPQSGDKTEYYRAILQNLFFATLNTPMDRDITDANREEKRGFIDPIMKGGKANPHYTDQTRYRYKEYFIHEEKALELFSTIPFLNGGLFECLDYPPDDGQPELRIDGFSTRKEKQAFVPNVLFFGDDQSIDLNDEYGTKNKPYKVKGLISIFNGYKFTITENTPLEEEVALDPELLGKVFENLLATYNPETKTTARKQTGSFYTPREIVNYMVDESLIAYLTNSLQDAHKVQPQNFAAQDEKIASTFEESIRNLFSPTDPGHDFTEADTRHLIQALSHCRILDPACGSGAFPMGILHRMVDLLNKLDPENTHWKEIQKQRALAETKEAYDIGDQEERKIRLDEINKAFDESINNPDYARKLFLIQNCIYGVDIQQIAVQIAKLRFFISLVAEQKVDDSKPNRNILSMPNLETKFVAANTLIALEKPAGQLSLMSMDEAIEKKEKELRQLREKIFFTRKYHDKKKLKQQEKKCREELKKILIDNNMSRSAAEQMAGWNPFDPLKSSPYFDIETMFGFEGGFDVVIGNPPWIQSKNLKLSDKNQFNKFYVTAIGQYDLFNLFIERGLNLLILKGSLILITPDRFITNIDYKPVRRFLLINSGIKEITSLGDSIFENVSMPSAIIHAINTKERFQIKCRSYFSSGFAYKNQNEFISNEGYIFKIFGDNKIDSLLNRISETSDLLKNHLTNSRGVEIGKKSFLVSEHYIKGYKKFLRGEDIDKYQIKAGVFLNFSSNSVDYKDDTLYKGCKILIRKTGSGINAVIDTEYRYVIQTIYIFKKIPHSDLNEKYILASLNSNLTEFWYNFTFGEKDRKTFPHLTQGKVLELPILTIDRRNSFKLERIVDFILHINNNINPLSIFYEKLIDSIFYELYFPTEIQSAGCEVLEHLQHLPELKEEWDDANKLAVIEQVYRELSDPQHPVSVAMERMKQVEEVRIIEASVQSSKGKGRG